MSLSQLITDPSVCQLVTEVGILPSVPRIYQQFEQLLKSDHCDCDAVSHLVSQDPALSAKLLKVVNTAFFGLPKEVVSITDAVNFMGYEKIKSLVLVTELFQQVDQAILQRFDLDRIWMQAQTLAKRLASVAGVSATELEQTNAALMFQGIGELAVAAQAPGRYQTILDQVEKEGLTLSEAEQVVLNASHIHLSVFMLGVWGLPLPLPLLELTLLLLEPSKAHPNSVYSLLFASHFLTLDDTEKQLDKFMDQGFPEAWLDCAEECLGYERG